MPRLPAKPRILKPEHPLEWLTEPLRDEASFALKNRFGGLAVFLHDQQVVGLTMKDEPWRGVLICTFHEHQASLCAEIASLTQHPILKKWLYLPEIAPTFERDAQHLVRLIRARDPRIGIPLAAPKKKAGSASAAPSPARGRPIRFGDQL